jgi:hypothetical protein
VLVPVEWLLILAVLALLAPFGLRIRLRHRSEESGAEWHGCALSSVDSHREIASLDSPVSA